VKIVPSFGSLPNDILLVGEMPGETEAIEGRPFIGASGKLQKWHLSRYNIDQDSFYLTNLVKQYIAGNPDPTPDQINYWSDLLISEIYQCNPRLIIAVGRFAVQWFLGDSVSLDLVHGLPHRSGAFDPTRINRAPSHCAILPIYHPASTFYGDEKRINRQKILLMSDYRSVSEHVSIIRSGKDNHILIPVDKHLGNEHYLDVTGKYLSDLIYTSFDYDRNLIGLDTEGDPSNPWSVQVSWSPGEAYTLRCSQPDFHLGIAALQDLARYRTIFYLHCANTPQGCMYDIFMCRIMGLNLTRANIRDTMYDLYLTRTEPLGLKPASYRLSRGLLEPYETIIEGISKEKQVEYLTKVAESSWSKPEKSTYRDNDGTWINTKPWSIDRIAKGIIKDVESGKVDNKGNLTDPYKRWKKADKILKREVESRLGLMPYGSLDDIPLHKSVYYASKDADFTLRNGIYLDTVLLPKLDLLNLAISDSRLHTFMEYMQSSGMPASKSAFENQYREFDDEYFRLQTELTDTYNDGIPINPNSPPQVSVFLSNRDLKSVKRTKTGRVSTGKKAIEHLRYDDPAIDLVFRCREVAHLRDGFCGVILETFPYESDSGDDSSIDIYDTSCNFKIAHTETRRLSTENPNLLAVPSRTEQGRKIRSCFICRPGELFGAWDFSQIEARVMADESQDRLLCKFFIEKRDIHSETAKLMFGVSGDPTSRQRRDAKDINFGIIYGISGSGLYDQFRMRGLTDWTEDRCSEAIKEWYKIYSGVRDYQSKVIKETRRLGYVRDRWGMYRYLPNIWSRDDKLCAEAERHCVSHRIQGGAQGMFRNSMGYLAPIVFDMIEAGLNMVPRLPVHDELIFTFQKDLEDTMDSLVTYALINHNGTRLRVPVEADGHTGKSWGKLKG
jgi:uracil-DNA glycosylase family 4